MNTNHSVREKLIKIIKQAPHREWIEQYLDLIEEAIEFSDLASEDPRLVLSIASNQRLAVTINRRYVLAGFRKGKPLVGFMFPYDFSEISELLFRAEPPEIETHQYKPSAGEIQEKCPYFLAFEGYPQSILTLTQKEAWKQAFVDEIESCDASPYKKYHTIEFYETVMNRNYRKALLNEAFPKINIDIGTDIRPEYSYLKRVPSVDEYKVALRKIEDKLNPKKKLLLESQYFAPEKSVTALQLASLVSVKSHVSINAQYGKLAHLLGDAIGLDSGIDKDGSKRWWNILSIGHSTREGFVWEMRPELAEALEQLGWVTPNFEKSPGLLIEEFDSEEENSAYFWELLPEEVDLPKVYREGEKRRSLIYSYDRNPKARKECIKKHGYNCSVCQFNFGKVFGELGEGFIHVHHLRPISEIGQEYIIDPVKDLRPVCPNCHAMLHRGNRLLSIEELQQLYRDRNSKT